MARPRRRKLRAGDRIRFTIPTPEIAAYLERWGPDGVRQAITAGLMLLMRGDASQRGRESDPMVVPEHTPGSRPVPNRPGAAAGTLDTSSPAVGVPTASGDAPVTDGRAAAPPRSAGAGREPLGYPSTTLPGHGVGGDHIEGAVGPKPTKVPPHSDHLALTAFDS